MARHMAGSERWRARWGRLGPLGLVAAAALAATWVRPRLVQRFERVEVASEVYALPAPQHLVVLSLGYRAALADLLYATVRVSYGLHLGQGRRFEFVGDYLDAMTTLDPTFRSPYLYADTFLTLQARKPRYQDYLDARAILERGMRNRPYDTKLWLTAGQYMAYLASAHVPEQDRAEWRLAGARALSRACELANDNEHIPHHCLSAAGLLSRAGETEALIEMLTRTLAVTDDEAIRKRALAHLRFKVGEQYMQTRDQRLRAFRRAWEKDLPFVSKDMLLLLGPAVDAARCAGKDSAGEPGCETTWADWGRRLPRLPTRPLPSPT